MKFALSLFLGLMGAAASATAAPVSYNINFTLEAGVAPTSGSFQYDSVTQTFTSFDVTWGGLSFNLTSAANAPTGNTLSTCGNTGAAYFSYLSGTNSCGAIQQWTANSSFGFPGGPGFPASGPSTTFGIGGLTGGTGQIMAATSLPTAAGQFGRGSFGITSAGSGASPTPEPSSLVLMLGSGALLEWRRRRASATTKDARLN